MKKSAPEPEPASPIPFHPHSNGEVPPLPFTARDQRADELYRRIVDEKSRRLGLSRREFTQSACGFAAALFVINQVYGCSSDGSGASSGDVRPVTPDAGFGREAGYDVDADVSAKDAAAAAADARYDVAPDALEDQDRAAELVDGGAAGDFIFDVQTHNRVPKPPWQDSVCAGAAPAPMTCPSRWIQEIFVASDTDVACLSGFPSTRDAGAPSIEARQKIKQIVDELSGSPRLLLHANVRPIDGAVELDGMTRDARNFPVAAWKIYPEARGVDTDEVGRPFLERARQLGVKIVAAHRGLGNDGSWTEQASPRDVVTAAKASPDITFLVYHSGFQSGVPENHPFNPADPSPRGIDRLIKAVLDNGLGPTSNVYAELGSTWNNVMRDTETAAHVLGRLLKYLGPDRILWGTDTVLTGSPQSQIAPFRGFEIPALMQMMYGYPALTPEVKRKIFGLNAARVYGVDPAAVRRTISADDIARIKLARREDARSFPLPAPSRGPRSWREWLWWRGAGGDSA